MTSVISNEFICSLSDYAGNDFVLLQDNARIHYSALAVSGYRKHRSKVISPPPYTPEGNAIEMLFANIKNAVKKATCCTKAEPVLHITEYLRDNWTKTMASRYLGYSIREILERIKSASKLNFNILTTVN